MKTQSTNTKRAFMMCGMPGSGKSTYVENELKIEFPNIVVISRDIIRHEMGFTKSVDDKQVLRYELEMMVTRREYEMIDQCINEGVPFVIDDMNSRNKFRRPMVEYIKERGYSVTGINIRTDFEICVKRRENQIDKSTMKQIMNRLEWLTDEICDEVFDVVTTIAHDVNELESIIKERY